MSNNTYQIFDKICKRILTLSAKAVINLINGLFGTNYPTDSSITYNWTEYENQDLKKTLADTILTINNRFSYHIEIQMTEDEEILFRVIEYGFGHAYHNRITAKGKETLFFPAPIVLYLSDQKTSSIPEEYELTLDFGNQGIFLYRVPVTILQNISVEELTNRKMVILIPFYLLKLRKNLSMARSETVINELKSLIENDIINSIELNVALGNISSADGRQLLNMTKKLYQYLYSHYEDMEDVAMMIDESLELETDILDAKIEKLEERVTELGSALAEKISALAEMDSALAKKDSALAEKDSLLAKAEAENLLLKQQLEKLQNKQ